MRNTKSLLAIFLACMMVMSCIVAVPVVAAEATATGSASFDGTYTAPATFSTWDGTSSDTEWSGSGSETDPYLITSAAELAGLAKQVNTASQTYKDEYFRLDADIDLANKEWTPISYATNTDATKFLGHFDGNGKVIANMSSTGANSDGYAGLFGYAGGSVKNLTIANAIVTGTKETAVVVALTGASLNVEKVFVYNADIEGSTYRGSIIGRPGSGTFSITDCYVSGTIGGTAVYAGGLVGGAHGGTPTLNVSDCTVATNITSGGNSGGLVGYFASATPISVENTKITGTISGGQYTGGVAGQLRIFTTLTLNNVSVSGNIKGTGNSVSGLVGGALPSSSVADASGVSITITDCSVTSGKIEGGAGYIGGVLGLINSPLSMSLEITGTTVTSAINDTSTSAGYVGGMIGQLNGTVPTLTFTDNTFSGSITTSGSYAGGMIGNLGKETAATFTNCTSTGTITTTNTSNAYAGALVGWCSATSIAFDDCVASGSVTASARGVGGLLGMSSASVDVTVNGCYVNATLSSTGVRVGGFVGALSGGSGATAPIGGLTVKDSMFNGTVEGSSAVGAILGATVHNAYTVGVENTVVLGTVTAGSAAGLVVGSHGVSLAIEDTVTVTSLYHNANITTLIGAGGTSVEGSTVLDNVASATYYTPNESDTNFAKADNIGIADFANTWLAAVGDLDWFKAYVCTECTELNLGVNADGDEVVVTCDKMCANTLVKIGTAWGGGYATEWYNNGVTENGVTTYTISNANDLAGLAAIVNGTADGIEADDFAGDVIKLAANIYLNDTGATDKVWVPIGANDFTSGLYFRGTFDGQGKTIANMYIVGGNAYAGFFGNVGDGFSVKNITFTGANVVARNVGGLVVNTVKEAVTGDLTFENVTVKNSKVSTTHASRVAAMIGQVDGSIGGTLTFDNCSVIDTEVSATIAAAAGLVGYSTVNITAIKVNKCTVGATIEGIGQSGGFFGRLQNAQKLDITDSIFNGNIDVGSNTIAGGLIGMLHTVPTVNISATVSGTISGGEQAAGLVGQAYSTSTMNIYVTDTDVSATINGTTKVSGMFANPKNPGVLSVKDSSFTGTVNSTGDNNGAIAAYPENSSCEIVVDNVAVAGKVSGVNFVGGVVGRVYNAKSLTVENSKISTEITATTNGVETYVGGVSAYVTKCPTVTITNCSIEGSITGKETAATKKVYGAGIVAYSYKNAVDYDITGVSITPSITLTAGTPIAAGVITQIYESSVSETGTTIDVVNCYIAPKVSSNYSAGLVYTLRTHTLTLGNNVLLGDYTYFDLNYVATNTVTQLDGTTIFTNTTNTPKKVSVIKISDEAVVDFANAWGTATANYTAWSACSNCEGSGWIEKANAADGQYRVSCVDMCKGVTAEARSVSVVALGGSVRYLDPFGVRFGGRVYGAAEGSEYGVLMIPTTMLNGAELTVDNADALNALKIKAEKTFPGGNANYVDGAATFTGVVYDIPDTAYDTQLTAVVYYTVNGVTYYSNVMTASYYDVAKLVLANTDWVADNAAAAATLQAVVNYVDAQ